jgi:hypothetical protein
MRGIERLGTALDGTGSLESYFGKEAFLDAQNDQLICRLEAACMGG